jgi:hypothetical protein
LHGWSASLLTILVAISVATSARLPIQARGVVLPPPQSVGIDAAGSFGLSDAVGRPAHLRPLAGSLSSLPAWGASERPALRADMAILTQGGDQATLEMRQPEVQWSPSGAVGWQSVPTRQDVRAGDRVRTGTSASARLLYFEGTVTEVGPETGLIVQRLQRSPEGSLVASLYQAVGSTVSRVVQLVDPSASFEVETPAATALVRGTMPEVIVGPDGVTRINNIPDDTGGTVSVQGKDPNASVVGLAPGQSTRISPGQPPSAPAGIGLGLGAQQAPSSMAQEAQGAVDRQQQRQQQQAQARQAVAQAQVGLANAAAQLERLTQQEQQLLQTIVTLLTPTPTPLPAATPRTSPTVPAGGQPPPTLTPLPTPVLPGACPGGLPPPGQIGPPPTTHGIFTATTGVAPNRTFVVEWRVEHFIDSANTANFEVQLEEGTNRIYFVYNASVDAGASATAGIQQGTGTTAIQVSCDQPVLTNGRAIQFAPGGSPAPTPPGAAAPCPGTDAFGYVCTNVSRPFLAGTVDIGNHCDDCVTTGVPLPFPFVYYGQTFTQVNVSSNGNLQFSSTNTSFTENGLPDPTFNQTIFVMWDDWVTSGFGDAPLGPGPRDCRRLGSPKCGAAPPPLLPTWPGSPFR